MSLRIAHKVATGAKYKQTLQPEDIEKILGPRKYSMERFLGDNPPGVSIGLAWTSVGGEILFIESILSPGKGGLKLTGNLGEVMKESAVTASVISERIGTGIDPCKCLPIRTFMCMFRRVPSQRWTFCRITMLTALPLPPEQTGQAPGSHDR